MPISEEELKSAYEATKNYGGLKKFAEERGIDYGWLRKELSIWRKKKGLHLK